MFNDIKPGEKVEKAQLKPTSDHFDKRTHNDEGYHPETFFISMQETLIFVLPTFAFSAISHFIDRLLRSFHIFSNKVNSFRLSSSMTGLFLPQKSLVLLLFLLQSNFGSYNIR